MRMPFCVVVLCSTGKMKTFTTGYLYVRISPCNLMRMHSSFFSASLPLRKWKWPCGAVMAQWMERGCSTPAAGTQSEILFTRNKATHFCSLAFLFVKLHSFVITAVLFMVTFGIRCTKDETTSLTRLNTSHFFMRIFPIKSIQNNLIKKCNSVPGNPFYCSSHLQYIADMTAAAEHYITAVFCFTSRREEYWHRIVMAGKQESVMYAPFDHIRPDHSRMWPSITDSKFDLGAIRPVS